jgi:phosphomannomutase
MTTSAKMPESASALSQILQASPVAFGTSGARGLVTDLTDEVCAAYTQAFIRVMAKNGPVNRIALGMDLRPSSPKMVAACAGAAAALGVHAEFFGVLPTPALACYAMSQGIPAIMVTGSHIPFDRNGLKFYRPDGEISKDDEHAISSCSALIVASSSHQLPVKSEASEHYLARYLQFYPLQPLTGKRVGIYLHSSAGRALYPRLFRELGAEVVELEPSDQFVPIDTEAVSAEDREKGRQFAKTWQLDAIFSTDGDGDRPLLADEHGHWLRGDVLCLLTAQLLQVSALAVPVSCNSIIEKSNSFAKVVRTRIGSPYVIASFADLATEYPSVAGFEANGGFLLGSDLRRNQFTMTALPTRDAVLPALEVLVAARNSSVSTLVVALPSGVTMSDRLQQVDVARCRQLLANAVSEPQQLLHQLHIATAMHRIDNTDGWRCYLDDESVVHLRLSGNAPELRVYIEALASPQAEALLQQVLERLPLILNSEH